MLQFQGEGGGSISYGVLQSSNFKDNNTTSINEEEEQQQGSMKKGMDGGDWISGRWKKTEEASEKHAFAERKRRKRINDHYNTLRHLFPHLPKRDKVTVLTEAVRRVKELRKMVADVATSHDGDRCGDGGGTTGSSSFFFPGENDEATVTYCCDGGDGKTVKATVCCDERPGLNRDLTKAIRSVNGRVVRAEMSTIGGRTKAVMVVRWPESGGEEDVVSLRSALKAVVENRALGSTGNIGLMGRILTSSKWAGSGPEFQSGKRSRICSSIGDGLSDGLLLSCI